MSLTDYIIVTLVIHSHRIHIPNGKGYIIALILSPVQWKYEDIVSSVFCMRYIFYTWIILKTG